MRNKKILLLIVLTMIAGFAVSCCHAGERYGPWRYYAPYYFPPGGCDGHCWSPLDFLPTYESPLPHRPSYDPGPRMRPGYPAKVRNMARPAHSAVGSGRPMAPPRTYRRSQFDAPDRDTLVPSANRQSPDSLVGGRPRPIDHPGPQPRSLNRPAPTSSAY